MEFFSARHLCSGATFSPKSTDVESTEMQFSKKGLEAYMTDSELESKDGVWREYGRGIRIRILRAGGSNRKYERVGSAILKPYQRQISRSTMDPELSTALLREIYSKAVVVDWSGVRDLDGNDVPCIPENIEGFFEAVPDLFDEVMADASAMATFAQEQVDAAVGELGNL